MKQGKRPTRKQKQLLAGAKLDPKDWLIAKSLPDAVHITHRYSGKERILKLGRTI